MGSMNFSKLHPRIVSFFSAVPLPSFQVTIWGDEINSEKLLKQCEAIARPHLLKFSGYTTDVAKVFSTLDYLLIYLTHYITEQQRMSY
jgi:hypothetical protein